MLKLPVVVISYDFVVSGLAASPSASFRCTSEDARAISNDFEIVNKPACFVFLIGMIEQEVFDLLKIACLANVENHNISRPSILISNAVNRPLSFLSNGLHPMCFPSLSIVYYKIVNRI
jgi:hypothetical protein